VAAYRVVSGPVRLRKAAEERRRVLAVSGLAAEVREQADGYVLDFGVFQDAAAAESVARAVRSRGYGTSVEPVRTPAYTLTVGPLAERAVLAVARTLREAGAEFTVVSGR
jgi:cell division septation protein DedD